MESHSGAQRRGWGELAIAGVVFLVASVVVFGGALRYFFSQDDFEFLARAAGLIPRVVVFTLPLVVVAMRLQDRTLRLRDPVLLSLIGIAVLHAASIEAIHVFGIGVEPPHEIRFGSDVLDNFLTYAGWTANFLIVTVHGITDAVDTTVFPWAW